MEITVSRIQEGYKNLLKTDDYKNYIRNKKLNDGKSKEVFYKEVVKRVNLQYMGLVDETGYIGMTMIVDGKLVQNADKVKFSDLIVGDGTLKAATEVYKELAADKEPVMSIDNDFLKGFDFKELIEDNIKEMSYGGGTLLKGIKNKENDITVTTVPRNRFFEIYNEVDTKKIDAYVVFSYQVGNDEEKTDILNVEIYTDGNTTYKRFNLAGDKLTPMTEDETRQPSNYKGWQVGYIKCISDFDEDVVSNVRELVVGETLNSQGFDKVSNPLIEAPESLMELDEEGKGTVNLKDRIALISDDSKRGIQQVALETKGLEWEVKKKSHLKSIYVSMGINENVLGISDSSMGESSGEAIKKSYQRTISRVNTKRNKVYKALETVLNWGYGYSNKGVLDLEITGRDIIELSKKEQLENDKLEIENLNALSSVEREDAFAKVIKDKKDGLIKSITG